MEDPNSQEQNETKDNSLEKSDEKHRSTESKISE